MPELKILLVDHSELFRQGLVMLINNQPGLKIVAQCVDAATAVVKIAQLKPDVVLLASDLPQQGSVELAREVNKKSLRGNILALANKFDAVTFRNLMKQKVKGYLLKSGSMESLVTAIKVVATGKVYLDPDVVTDCLDQIFVVSDSKSELRIRQLSPREEQVMRMWATGVSAKQIAEHLNLSPKTIDTMRARAFTKLGLRNRGDAINYALKEGWLSEADAFASKPLSKLLPGKGTSSDKK